jgi:hypothetical protein
MLMIKVIILADTPQTLSIFGTALDNLGIHYEKAESVLKMRKKMQTAPFNGVILDVLTTIKAAPQEKIIIQEISELYPTLRLRWDSRNHCFRGLIIGETLDQKHPISDFLQRFCYSTPERVFRQHKRLPIHFNVLISQDEEFSENKTEKSVTLDISGGGCFLFSTRNWEKIDVAWVRFLDFSEKGPYRVQICRFLPWGRGKFFPGIGVKFVDLTPDQIKELGRQLNHKQGTLP